MRAWSRALYDAGYVGLTWPKEYGGGGAPYTHQAIFLEEMARAEAPPHIGVIGLGMAGPTIIAHGTEEQKARYLAPILSAEEIWCQGFSEPGAGSDLAGVRTSARLDGGHFVVDGQKVWSSFAHIADWCILLTRTDPELEPPRRAHVPHRRHARAGRRGAAAAADHGRGGVQRDLLHGRAGAGGERPRRGRRGLAGRDDDAPARARDARLRAAGGLEVQIRKLVALARDRGADPLQRDRIAREWIELQALRFTNYRSLSAAHEDRDPGPRGIDREARLVGGEPARHEARARAARPGRAARRRQRALRRLLAVPAAPQPRQHHRGGHLGDPPQHRRRARARPPQVAMAWTSRSHPSRRSFASRRASSSPRTPSRPGASSPSSAGRASRSPRSTAAPGSRFLEEAVLFEELGRALYHGPYFSTIALTLPALPDELQAEVAAGEASWTLALGPLVPDLDTAERVAIVGGDGIYELEGGEREILETRTSRGRSASCAAGARPQARGLHGARRGSPARARRARARGVRRRAARARARDRVRGRARAVREARSASTRRSRTRSRTRTHVSSWRARSRSGRPGAWRRTTSRRRSPPQPRRRTRPRRRSFVCETAIQAHGGIGFTWEHVLHRLYKRALWIESFLASGTRLRAEVAAALLEGTTMRGPHPSDPVSVTQGG